MGIRAFGTSLKIGVRRRWKGGIATALSVLGAIWLVTEVATRAHEPLDLWLNEHGTLYLIVASVSALIGFLIAIYEPRSVSFCIPTTYSELTLKFANLFGEDADWLVGVNEFFDSQLGDLVSPISVHGQLVQQHFGGNEAAMRAAVDRALDGEAGTQVERLVGQNVRYDLGTTAVLERGDKHIFLVAVTRTDPVNNKASSDIPTLWVALQKALRKVHERGNGQPLALPLLGNGRSSINLPPQHLLRLVTLGIVDAARTFQLPRSITLTLHEDCFSAIDLREIRRDWRSS